MTHSLRIVALVIVLLLTNVTTAQGESLPEFAYISGLIGHAQGYSLSCESRSAADWAAFWGVNIGETEFLLALPRSANPDEGFVGDPNDVAGTIPPNSYGVHADPVADTLRGFGLEAEAQHDLSWDDLRVEISAGRPVIVWVLGQMRSGTPVEYEAPDGSTTAVAYYEHTMILVGYSSDSVQVVDASSGQYENYGLDTFLKSWAVLGNMAVFGSYEALADDAILPGTQSESYTVQQGDYLIALARRFGTSFQVLADLNSIGYPFTIFPGQVLQLPESVQPPASEEIGYQVHLPMVQRNSADQMGPSNEIIHIIMALVHTAVFLP